jgi:DNA (cytosine-5)-methyltransferase 1
LPFDTAPETIYTRVPFTFIDLFAGIGGFRAGLQAVGGSCVYSSEWDKYSAQTYSEWYGDPHTEQRDFTTIDYSKIPPHDVLAAGFPCQPFSLAGVSKKNSMGRPHGFRDREQGNLFFAICEAVVVNEPPVLFLENVKHLLSHDKGNTWRVIQETLIECGYHVFHSIIDACGWVPQHRERIFIVCFRKEVFGDNRSSVHFRFPDPPSTQPELASILDPEPPPKYMLSDALWRWLQDHSAKHRSNGNGFGYGIAEPDGVTRTLSARYHKDGSEILIQQDGWKNPRRLTPDEAALLQGFDERYSNLFGHDERFPIVVSDTQAYRQLGNAVVPKVVEAIGERIASVLAEKVLGSGSGCLVQGRSLSDVLV